MLLSNFLSVAHAAAFSINFSMNIFGSLNSILRDDSDRIVLFNPVACDANTHESD